ncbi:MAG: DUF6485 family protein [Chitinispirillaceae bacterium]
MVGCAHQKKLVECSCTYPCSRHGKCCECIVYHRDARELPGCYFTASGEKTYDRSFEAFARDHRIQR